LNFFFINSASFLRNATAPKPAAKAEATAAEAFGFSLMIFFASPAIPLAFQQHL